MKPIEERARLYAKSQGGVGNINDPIYKAYMQGCADNFRALTEWHDPKDLPDNDRYVLLKVYIKENNEHRYTVGNYRMGIWHRNLIFSRDKIVGWREIHE